MKNNQRLAELCSRLWENHSSQIQGSELVLIIATVLSTIATIAACYIAYRQSKTSRDSFVYSLHEKYMQIMNEARKENEPFSRKVQQIYANFYEQVCWFLSKNKVSSQDIELFYADLKNPKIVKFVTEQRKKNPEWYKFYWSWYSKNKNL